MDREVEELARLSLLEERLSVLRHDLRNRLSSIRNGSFYLKRKSEKTELWNEDRRFPLFFDLIEKEIAGAEELLAEEASAVDVMTRQLESQSLEVGVRRGLAGICIPATVDLKSEFAEKFARTLWAPEIALLTRCLVQNAVEAMSETSRARIRIRTRSDGDGTRLTVEDSGPGIPTEAIASAMQPFRSQKPGHLGIGLNVARRIAQRYDATLTLGEAEGGGLSVEVLFP